MTVDVGNTERARRTDDTELGVQSELSPAYSLIGTPAAGLPTVAYTPLDLSEAPELRFPRSSRVYDAMHRTDSNVVALERAITLSLLGARWHLLDDDVDPRVSAFVASELGLDGNQDVAGRRRRRRHGIVWSEHLRHALLMLRHGSAFFEIVYQAAPPAPGQDLDLPVVHHLRKIGWRSPRTLREVLVSRDGNLLGIVQEPPPGTIINPAEMVTGIYIPVERLVAYVNDREGSDWGGQSLLRAVYRNFLVSDQLIRTGAQSVERNNMGVPVVTYDTNDQRAHAIQIARDFRSGALAGVALPKGMSLALVGVSGSTKDELPVLRYHDEKIAQSALAMFMSLGASATGSRALGQTFEDKFTSSLMAVAKNIAETTTEHVIRDLVERNFGPDEAYPVLTLDDLTSDMVATPETIVSMAGAGLLGTIDQPLTAELRRRLQLPQADDQAPAVPLQDDTTPEDQDVPAPVLAQVLSEAWYEDARTEMEVRLAAMDVDRAVTLFKGAPGVVDRSPGATRLRDYWTKGEGLAKWADKAHPWTTLERLLREYIADPEKRKATATRWYFIVFKRYPSEKR